MSWQIINFGKYSGKTLPQVLLHYPDWFFLAFEEGAFDNRGPLADEADDLYNKATNIKIPNNNGELVAEYLVRASTGKFLYFEIVPLHSPQHEGGNLTFRFPVIDLSAPRKIAKHDKLGCKQLLYSFKRYVFGSPSTRLTKNKCEEFFKDNTNFT
ncbi:MAG: hypothetical protein KAR20_02275 [Candidatus Heimdallarchaeota archaeon]|nr:hypothetical protein [Candidatus Heimdallarchaeota archaeon]